MRNKGRHTLPRSEILRGKKAFKELFENGTFIRGKSFNAVFIGTEASPRVAFAAVRRVKKAVERNQIKRRIREAFRLEKEAFKGKANILFIGKDKIISTNLKKLRGEMRAILEKIHRAVTEEKGISEK